MNATRTCALMSILLAMAAAVLPAAEPPRYRFQADQQFAYAVDITAELPTEVQTLTGRISYRVQSVSEPLKVSYSGGLDKTVKSKPGRSSAGPPFGPFGPRIAPPPSPFARNANPFRGLESTINQIALNSRGEILTLEGSSQLPFLLGNLSLLVFEPLPETDQRSWTVDSGVTIKEGGEQSRDRFGPIFDPFFRQGANTPERTSTGGESQSFTLQSSQGDLATYRRTYRLNSPGDATSMAIEGSGTWTFNRRLGISESLDFRQDLKVEEDNTTVTIPVVIKYRRLTAEELAKIEQERLEAERKREEEQARRMAEQGEVKRLAEAPLEPARREELLRQLASGDPGRIAAGLAELAGKSPLEPDPEIAAAIELLLQQENKTLKEAAEKALVQWSPDFKRKHEVNNGYQGPRPVGDPARPLPPGGPLFLGQIVAVKWGSSWYPAEVKELLPEDKIKVAYRGWGSRQETVARSHIQLAPGEVDQPNLAPSELATLQGKTPPTARTWTDSTGTYRVEAEFVALENGNLVLKRSQDGREVRVPLARLSVADQQAAQEAAKRQTAAVDNPFEP